MEKRGASPFGDPCGGCGFEWSLTPREAIGIVQELPTRFRVLLAGRTGFGRHPDLAWTPAAYVSHVTANLRNWAERLAGARLYGAVDVPGHDPDLVVQARHYNEIAPRRGPVVVGTRSGSLGGIDQDRTVIRADPRQPPASGRLAPPHHPRHARTGLPGHQHETRQKRRPEPFRPQQRPDRPHHPGDPPPDRHPAQATIRIGDHAAGLVILAQTPPSTGPAPTRSGSEGAATR